MKELENLGVYNGDGCNLPRHKQSALILNLGNPLLRSSIKNAVDVYKNLTMKLKRASYLSVAQVRKLHDYCVNLDKIYYQTYAMFLIGAKLFLLHHEFKNLHISSFKVRKFRADNRGVPSLP